MIGAKLTVPDRTDVAECHWRRQTRFANDVDLDYPASETKFRVHLPDGPVDELSLDDALSLARITATQQPTTAQDMPARKR